jgi:hypothetical protein
MTYDFIEDGIPHVIVSDCYYESKTIAKRIPAMKIIKLPRRGTYEEGKLVVCVNTISLRLLTEYNYDNKTPHDSIFLTFDLFPGDVITFRTIV